MPSSLAPSKLKLSEVVHPSSASSRLPASISKLSPFLDKNEAQRKQYSFKTQANDKDGLGGKISEDDKNRIVTLRSLRYQEKTTEILICMVLKPAAQARSTEDLEEKLAGPEPQSIVNPITSKLYLIRCTTKFQ
ncbi:hypothetical protein M378DRAFT_17367 [Amanita muscaria Koide BX008]|uniref:Uncharacterized protein n=1 Tax=Amanita muscaria (strain Koide BX008) TaxID=946122 RepID=A0A0C2SQ36_AMAMK|nr:hypothetical protein M378DRAFT_17367 [Amanita muscaria Koide BX008]